MHSKLKWLRACLECQGVLVLGITLIATLVPSVVFAATDATALFPEREDVNVSEAFEGALQLEGEQQATEVAPLQDISGDGFSFDTNTGLLRVTSNVGTTNWRQAAIHTNSVLQLDLSAAVTIIDDDAFHSCSSITSVVLPASLSIIGARAFAFCTSLSSITLPTGLQSIGSSAFHQSGLTSIALPPGLKVIGDDAFNKCSMLLSANIPAGVISLGEGIFYGCGSLHSISLPTDLTKITDRMFAGCAFASLDLTGCTALESLGRGAFVACDFTQIYLPASLTAIGDTAFERCENLISITLPAGLSSIGVMAFGRCYSLTSIVLPEVLEVVAIGAFTNCTSLASVSFPASITSLGMAAFFDCRSLRELYFSGSVAPILDTSEYGSFCGLPTGGRVYYSVGNSNYNASYFNVATDADQFSTWYFGERTESLLPPATNIYPVLTHFGNFTGSGTRTAKIGADLLKFERLVCNATGAAIDPANYTTASGSTLITLTEAHLKTYALGTYTFVAEYSDGRSEDITLTVSVGATNNGTEGTAAGENSAGGKNARGGNMSDTDQLPFTGDSAVLPLLVVALISAGASTLLVARRMRRVY